MKSTKKLLLLLTIGVLIGIDSFGQTIGLGSGSTESSNYNSSPVNIYYRRTVCQFVYTASELSAAGASTTSPITELGFYVTESPIYNIPGYTIKLKHTTQTDVSSALGTTGWTTVKNSHTYNPTAGGYDMIAMDNGFTWDGVNNIGVEICWSRVTPSWNASGKVRVYNTTNGYRYRWTDANGNSCGSTPNTTSNDKPQIRMVFIPGNSTTWIGGTSTDWFEPSNWTTGVPTASMNTVIPSGTTFSPIISTYDAKTQDIDIQSGATLSFNSTETLEVHGNWLNNGSLVTASGNVSFEGMGPNTVDGGTQTFNNLTVNSVSGISFNSGNYAVQGSFYMNGGTVNTNNRVELLSNASGTARIPEIKGVCQYRLDMTDSYGDGWNGGYITILIDGVASGNYSCSGSASSETLYVPSGSTLDVVYTSGIYENENRYSLLDPLLATIFSDGTNPTTGNVFSTTSNCTFSNPISGNISFNRYIDAGATHWRFLTLPVSDGTLDDFNDDFITSGFPGTDYPTWPSAVDPWESMWFYNEVTGTTYDDGLYAPSGITDALNAGQGVWIWCGDTSTGTQPFTIDVNGTTNVGDIDYGVTYTPAAGNAGDDGWNLVANPYPCTIDWDSPNWSKTNIANALYVWNPDLQQYASYVFGIGVNGGSRYIAPWQAMYVQTTAASPSLIIHENCKVDQDQTFIKSQISSDHIRLEFEMAGQTDETVIRFDADATDDLDPNYDAQAFTANFTTTPRMYTEVNGLKYSINSLEDITAYKSIQLLITVPSGGSGTITATDLTDVPGDCFFLEDTQTGTLTNFMVDSSYSFTQGVCNENTRFILHFVKGNDIDVSEIVCSGDQNGAIMVNTHSLSGSDYIWKDGTGTIISTVSGQIGGDTLSGLSPGIYIIETNGWSGCAAGVDTVVLENPSILEANAQIEDESCSGCCDAEITPSGIGGVPPYQFSLSSSSNVVSSFQNLCSGIYQLNVLDNNGCNVVESLSVGTANSIDQLDQNEVKLFPNPGNGDFYVQLNQPLIGASIEIYNVIGERVWMKSIGNTSNINVDITDQEDGIYLYFIRLDNTTIKGQYLKVTE